MRYLENAPLTSYRGRSIIDTSHSIERGYEQRGVDPSIYPESFHFKREVIRVIKSGMDKILDNYKDYSSVYLIHSKGTGIGVTVNWRTQRDSKYDDGNNHAIIVSILPIKRKHYSKYPDDILLVVEDSIPRKRIKESLIEDTMDRVLTDFGFQAILWEGSVWDIDAAIILVD